MSDERTRHLERKSFYGYILCGPSEFVAPIDYDERSQNDLT